MTLIYKKNIICFVIALVATAITIALTIHVVRSSAKNPEVRTKFGTIQGLRADDGDYFMFMGVPYALVDKNNPFGKSTPHPPFDGVFKAHNDSEICPQLEEYNHTLAGSLDCLHLNIYVPNTENDEQNPFPVLVYIHGGRYEVGFAGRYLYGPRYFMRHDIILITVNFRLGPYGFLCVDTPEVSGNQGLKDQITALKWIKNNIDAFGGDPNKVTIAGVSSGGENVALHLMYGQEELFNQAIIESGLIPLIMNKADVTIPLLLAEDLGFRTENLTKALNFLSSQDTNSVIKSSYDLNITYRPCQEKQFENVDTFIINHTTLLSETPKLKDISIIVGQSNNEKLYVYANKKLESAEYQNIFKDELNDIFDFDNERLKRMEEYMRHFYIGDEDINEDAKQHIIDFSSDLLHNFPNRNNIDKYIKNGAKKIYYSVFSYLGGRNFIRQFYNINSAYFGASHSDEIGYLFDISYMKNGVTHEDQVIIDRMTTLWANFVKYSDPTPETSKLLPVKWEPVTNESLVYYNIDSDVSTGVRPFHDRMAFWDLFHKLNGKFKRITTIK